MAFDVRVIDSGGRAVKGVRVVLGFTSILRGMTRTEYTDSAGHASFGGYDAGEVEVLTFAGRSRRPFRPASQPVLAAMPLHAGWEAVPC
jgi:hypothetical protein